MAFFDRGGDRAGGYPGTSELVRRFAPVFDADREQADLGEEGGVLRQRSTGPRADRGALLLRRPRRPAATPCSALEPFAPRCLPAAVSALLGVASGSAKAVGRRRRRGLGQALAAYSGTGPGGRLGFWRRQSRRRQPRAEASTPSGGSTTAPRCRRWLGRVLRRLHSHPTRRVDVRAAETGRPAASTRLAFCEPRSKTGPATSGGRSGELDPSPQNGASRAASRTAACELRRTPFVIGPALIGACRAGLSNLPTRVLPGRSDVLVCDQRSRRSPRATRSRRWPRSRTTKGLATVPHSAAVRLRRTHPGTIIGSTSILSEQRPRRLARDLHHRRGSFARAELRLAGARLGTEKRRRGRVRFRLVQHAAHRRGRSFTPSPTTCRRRTSRRSIALIAARGSRRRADASLNHVEVYRHGTTHLEVWTSDASPDGVTFPNLHELVEVGDVDAAVLARLREPARCATTPRMKYWLGLAAASVALRQLLGF